MAGWQSWIKYILVVTVLFTCLFFTISKTGLLSPQTYLLVQPQPVYSDESPKTYSDESPKTYSAESPQTYAPVTVPVIPVKESDWNEAFPTYRKVPKDAYQTDWWKSAAFLEWDLENRPRDYECGKIKHVGNWWICVDDKYDITPPCLVYSFGIANDFSFDDAMAEHGCEVHSFDPSMKTKDYIRDTGVHFHAIGLSNHTDDKFLPRKDIYVKDNTTWTIMTLKLIKTSLGHTDRELDVLKIDVEGHEWAVIENLMEDNMFSNIKQFMLEYHLFPDWPKKSEYPKLLRTYKQLHNLGFQKFVTSMHPLTHIPKDFNIQADVAYVNTKYRSSRRKRKYSLFKSKR